MGTMLEAFDREAYGARAKTLRHRCPECGCTMRGTGKLFFLAPSHRWFVEYFCEREQETLALWADETQRFAEEIAADG